MSIIIKCFKGRGFTGSNGFGKLYHPERRQRYRPCCLL
jgi:hypothetical protein